MTTRVIEWDGTRLPEELRKLLPDQLRDLPAGHYVVEPIEDDLELTAEERAGILEAMDDLDRGQGVPFDEVKRQLRRRYAER